MQQIDLSQKLEHMLIGAERYACGRRTYIVSETVDYIIGLLPKLSDWCIGVMAQDMKEQFAMAERCWRPDMLGDDCDYRDWERFRNALKQETKQRQGG